jgi:hypothetical protein
MIQLADQGGWWISVRACREFFEEELNCNQKPAARAKGDGIGFF